MSNLIVVVAGLISAANDEPPFLLTRRLPDAHLGGYWEFPGGKMELGEDPVSTLKRELDEELGVQVQVGNVYAVGHHDYGTKTVLLIVYQVTIADGDPECKAATEVRWFEPIDLVRLALPPADVPIVHRLKIDFGLV